MVNQEGSLLYIINNSSRVTWWWHPFNAAIDIEINNIPWRHHWNEAWRDLWSIYNDRMLASLWFGKNNINAICLGKRKTDFWNQMVNVIEKNNPPVACKSSYVRTQHENNASCFPVLISLILDDMERVKAEHLNNHYTILNLDTSYKNIFNPECTFQCHHGSYHSPWNYEFLPFLPHSFGKINNYLQYLTK